MLHDWSKTSSIAHMQFQVLTMYIRVRRRHASSQGRLGSVNGANQSH